MVERYLDLAIGPDKRNEGLNALRFLTRVTTGTVVYGQEINH